MRKGVMIGPSLLALSVGVPALGRAFEYQKAVLQAAKNGDQETVNSLLRQEDGAQIRITPDDLVAAGRLKADYTAEELLVAMEQLVKDNTPAEEIQ